MPTDATSRHEINLSKHPDAHKLDKAQKVVFYQENPTEHWGPATKAKSFRAPKEKAQERQLDTGEEITEAEATNGTTGEPESQKRKSDETPAESEAKRAKVEGA